MKTNSARLLASAIGLATLLVIPTSAYALPYFRAVADPFGNCNFNTLICPLGLGGQDVTNSTGASATGSNSGVASGITYTIQAAAAANSGGLGASARVTLNEPAGSLVSTSDESAGLARQVFDDFIITGPVGSVQTSANVHLSGTFGTNVTGGGTSDVLLKLRMGVPTIESEGSFEQNMADTTKQVTTTGILAGSGTLPVNLTTPTFTLLEGVPFGFDLTMYTHSFAAIGPTSLTGQSALVDSLMDLSDPLSFPIGGPVFNLPPGYTLNSVEANIVDNQFGAAVPEPGTLMLVGSGMVALLCRKRRSQGTVRRINPAGL